MSCHGADKTNRTLPKAGIPNPATLSQLYEPRRKRGVSFKGPCLDFPTVMPWDCRLSTNLLEPLIFPRTQSSPDQEKSLCAQRQPELLLFCSSAPDHGRMFGNIQSQTDVSGKTNSEGPRGSGSKASCNVCRQRKVRCTKERPECVVCVSASQACSYPTLLRKRGPKIGSRHSRVRSRGDHQGNYRNDLSDDAGIRVRSGVHFSDDAMPEHWDAAPVTVPLSSSRPKDDILALSYILHPTLHPTPEKLSPEGQQELPGKTPSKVGMGSIFDSTCWHLGLTPKLLLRLYVWRIGSQPLIY